MKRLSWAKSVLLGVAVAAASNSAHAAPIVRDGYYEENVNVSCNAGPSCTGVFTAPASNSHVIIENVSCSIVAGATDVRRGLFGRLVGENVQRPQFLLPEFVAKNGGQNQYLINTAANLAFEAGEIPAIRVVTATSTSQTLACQIVGQLIFDS